MNFEAIMTDFGAIPWDFGAFRGVWRPMGGARGLFGNFRHPRGPSAISVSARSPFGHFRHSSAPPSATSGFTRAPSATSAPPRLPPSATSAPARVPFGNFRPPIRGAGGGLTSHPAREAGKMALPSALLRAAGGEGRNFGAKSGFFGSFWGVFGGGELDKTLSEAFFPFLAGLNPLRPRWGAAAISVSATIETKSSRLERRLP